MRKPTVAAAVILAVAFAWHLAISLIMNKEYCADPTPALSCNLPVAVGINPLNDMAILKMPGAADFGITDSTQAAGFNWGRDLTGVPEAEHQLNLYARRYFDIYAIFVPYRVAIVDRKSGESDGDLSSRPSTKVRRRAAHEEMHTEKVWANVSVLGFRAGESPEVASRHAVDLGMVRARDCSYRQNGTLRSPNYIDCDFAGNNGDSMQVTFYSGSLQRIEYKFASDRYEGVLAKVEKSFGNPRTLTDQYDPSQVVCLIWGGAQQKFNLSFGKTADGVTGWLSVVFNPPE